MKHVGALERGFCVSLDLPGSKSITLRDVLLASLASGPSVLKFPAECDDFSRIRAALIELGISIQQNGPESVSVAGRGGEFRTGPVHLDAGLSGTAARFLIALGLLRNDETTVDGLPPLRIRPQEDLVDAAIRLGASVRSAPGGGLPVSVQGPQACKASIQVKGNRSSQYLSALLLVGPLLPGGLGLRLDVDGELVSQPYIDITLREMHRFGVDVWRDGYRRFHVPMPHTNQPSSVSKAMPRLRHITRPWRQYMGEP